MPITGAFILPHPPIILHEVGHGEETKIQKTINSYKEIAKRIAELKPDTIVLSSPHSIMYADYFHISPGRVANGNLREFKAPSVSVSVEYDVEFVSSLEESAKNANIAAGILGEKGTSLDHATIIPLTFINELYSNYKLVRIGLSGLPVADHYKLGMCVADVAKSSGNNVVFVASGDLSHKVSADGPYGFAAEGLEFDKEIIDAMAKGDFLRFLTFTPAFTEKAAECGLRSFIIMAGALDGKNVKSELLSYEGTFGVGYAVASFIPMDDNKNRHFLERFLTIEENRMQTIKDCEDEYVRLARYSLEHYVTTGKPVKLPDTLLEELLKNKAGVFVSLKKQGNLRGCIGTISPVTNCIAEEIIQNAISACAQDPRFEPVQPEELSELVYNVDVLSPSEPITSAAMLDVKRYGVIVTSGYKQGLLLPNLDGVNTIEQQISIAMQKAGIHQDEKYSLARFEVVRHK